MNIWSFIEEKIHVYGEDAAFPEAGITYRKLIEEVRLRAERIRGKRRLICICRESKTQQALDILAALCAGSIAVPLSLDYGRDFTDRIKALIASDEEPCPPSAAVCAFSSGTSGSPKGVLLSHEGIIRNMLAIGEVFKVNREDRILITRPLCHMSAVAGELLLGLYEGAQIYFYEEAFSPAHVIKRLRQSGSTVFCTTPTVMGQCALTEHTGLSLKKVCLSGEILTPERAELLARSFTGTEFYNGYGLTENSPRVSFLRPGDFLSKPGSAGLAIAGTELKIENGELIVRSPSLMLGYYKDPVRSEKALREGWLHTGDRAHMDEDGYIYIDGRMDNMIVRAGVNIYPEEIERVLLGMEGVRECVVRGEADRITGQHAAAYIAGDISPAQARAYAIKRLPQYMVPGRFYVYKSLPVGPGGKKKPAEKQLGHLYSQYKKEVFEKDASMGD